MAAQTRRFYGWPMAVVAWLLYGFGVMPFYSWGFLLPEMLAELGLSRADGGLAFGVGVLCGGFASPWVGVALTRYGTRKTMTVGYLLSAVAFLLLSRAQGLWSIILVYGVFSTTVHAFATVLPTQNLASTWFLRYRARMLAFLLTASGVLAPVMFAVNAWLVQEASWRTGWVVIGVLQGILGVVAWLVIRDSPESLGQLQDGARSQEELDAARPKREVRDVDLWSAREAVRTPQFALMLLCGIGYAVPWYVLNNHSRLHLQDLGFQVEAAAAILSIMALVSTAGRLSGAFGDFLSPPRLLGTALAVEAVGVVLFTYATTTAAAYTAVILIGLGFGAAYISQAATFAQFFGRRAFATTTGIRFMVGALFTATAPWLAGWWYDTRGSYTAVFLGLAGVTALGATIGWTIRSPRRPSTL